MVYLSFKLKRKEKMQIEIQEMFLDFMKKIGILLEENTEDKRKCFVFLHKAQSSAIKALQSKDNKSGEAK